MPRGRRARLASAKQKLPSGSSWAHTRLKLELAPLQSSPRHPEMLLLDSLMHNHAVMKRASHSFPKSPAALGSLGNTNR